MPKKLKPKTLTIMKSVFQKALRYSLSLNEVGFLFFGSENLITEVVRIKNDSSQKRNFITLNRRAYRDALESMNGIGLSLIAEGHSHSQAKHLKHPSCDDLKYFKKGLHIIVFPHEQEIRCWVLTDSIKTTLQSEVCLLTKSKLPSGSFEEKSRGALVM